MAHSDPTRPRLRDLNLAPGILPTGPLNAIDDVPGVGTGHFTLFEGADIRTGATAVLPHCANIYQEKVPAGIAVGNGYGKLMGGTQIVELGEIESPIVLTNTMSGAFQAVIEATEEAILNSLLRAQTMTANGKTVQALPLDATIEALSRYGHIQ